MLYVYSCPIYYTVKCLLIKIKKTGICKCGLLLIDYFNLGAFVIL